MRVLTQRADTLPLFNRCSQTEAEGRVTPSAWGHVFASSWRRYFMGVESRDFSEVLGTNFQ